jgi:uncharacterized membrane protein (DUF4010 family)
MKHTTNAHAAAATVAVAVSAAHHHDGNSDKQEEEDDDGLETQMRLEPVVCFLYLFFALLMILYS